MLQLHSLVYLAVSGRSLQARGRLWMVRSLVSHFVGAGAALHAGDQGFNS